MNFNSGLFQDFLHQDLLILDSELDVFRANVLKGTVLKKFISGSTDGLNRAAIDSFIERNEKLSNSFSFPVEIESIINEWRRILYDDTRDGEYQTCSLNLNYCAMHGYAGPGSSRGTHFTDFVHKMFCSDLTQTTSNLYRHYVSVISPRWLQAELARMNNHSVRYEFGSALSSVPKDNTKNRTICIEPSLNMFYQLGAKHYFEGVLRHVYNIDVSTQPDKNKALAKSASVDGRYATIDLKDASDSIHLELCRQILPSDVFNLLALIRSEKFEVDGNVYSLNMMSTMGNGFTFPLMTLLFASLYKAMCKAQGWSYSRPAVFGDDIIIPVQHYEAFTKLLEGCGFVVNLSKSFAIGFFRESCGGDFYHGYDVRGVYIKRIDNEADIYSAFNRLHRWSVFHGIALSRTLLYLKGLAKFRPVPRHAGCEEGFIMCSSDLRCPKRDRNGAVIYSSLSPATTTIKVGDFTENHWGALIGFLGSFVRNHSIMVRSKTRRYAVIKRKTPCWDYSLDPVILSRAFDVSWTVLLN